MLDGIQEELFKVTMGMWLEVKLGNDWVICQVIDITLDGKVVWVETHEDHYHVDRFSRKLRTLRTERF